MYFKNSKAVIEGSKDKSDMSAYHDGARQKLRSVGKECFYYTRYGIQVNLVDNEIKTAYDLPIFI